MFVSFQTRPADFAVLASNFALNLAKSRPADKTTPSLNTKPTICTQKSCLFFALKNNNNNNSLSHVSFTGHNCGSICQLASDRLQSSILATRFDWQPLVAQLHRKKQVKVSCWVGYNFKRLDQLVQLNCLSEKLSTICGYLLQANNDIERRIYVRKKVDFWNHILFVCECVKHAFLIIMSAKKTIERMREIIFTSVYCSSCWCL